MKFTASTPAWVTNDWTDPKDIPKLIADGREDYAASLLSYTTSDMSGVPGWARVGTAELTVSMFDDKVLVEKKIEALKDEIKMVKAETHQKVTTLEEKLQTLLALPNLENPLYEHTDPS